MNRVVLTLLGICLFCVVGKAQYDERGRLANDQKSAAAAAYQSKQSLFSLGSNNPADWTAPAQRRDGSWTQRYVYTNDNSTIRIPQRRVNSQAQQKAVKQAQRDSEHREWLEMRNERLRQAKKAQEARKRQEAAENAADRQAGYMRHLSLTDGYYKKQSDRDHYLATVAARNVDMNHTVDKVTTRPVEAAKPVVSTMSNNELADLLSPEPVGNVVFRPSSNYVSVTGNTDLDESVQMKWDWASNEKNILSVEHKKLENIGQSPVLLLSHDEFSLDSVTLFILPGYGLVMSAGDSLMVLKDSLLKCVAWQDGRDYYNVVACGNKLIGRTDNAVYDIEDQTGMPLVEFDTEEFMLFANDSRSIYALVWYDNISSVIKIDVEDKSYTEILRLGLPVWKVESNGAKTFILIENSIYILTEDGEPHLFYRSESTINDLVFSAWGLLLATDDEIIRISSLSDTGTFYPYGAYRIWTDGNEVYMLDIECNLLYIEK